MSYNLVDLLADHIGETYNTLAGNPKIADTKKAFGSSLPVRYGNQLADRFKNSMATAIDPNLPYWQKTDATMGLAGLAMTGNFGIRAFPTKASSIVPSAYNYNPFEPLGKWQTDKQPIDLATFLYSTKAPVPPGAPYSIPFQNAAYWMKEYKTRAPVNYSEKAAAQYATNEEARTAAANQELWDGFVAENAAEDMYYSSLSEPDFLAATFNRPAEPYTHFFDTSAANIDDNGFYKTPVYHGTPAPGFTGFDANAPSILFNNNYKKFENHGISAATDPFTANQYAGNFGGVYPLKVAGPLWDPRNAYDLGLARDYLRELHGDDSFAEMLAADGMWTGVEQELGPRFFLDNGYTGALTREGSKKGRMASNIQMFDMSAIRSPWAKFDPAKIKSSDLLAGGLLPFIYGLNNSKENKQ